MTTIIKLYNPSTSYEKDLYNKVFKFYNFVKSTEQNLNWSDFYKWLEDNSSNTKTCATNFLVKEMNERGESTSVDQTITLYEIVFRDWSVQIDESTTNEIKQRRRLLLEPAARHRHHQNTDTKNKQVDELLPMIPFVLEYCIDQQNFKEQLVDIDNSARSSFPNLSEATRKEIHTLTRKTDSELYRILLNTAAYLSVMVVTGSRPSELAKIKMKDVSWEVDRLLIHRTTAKDGKKRGSVKSVWCAIVPNKKLKLCAVVHLARHLACQQLRDDHYVFANGFTKKANQSEVSFITMITRRLTAVIEALFIIHNGVGIGGGNGGKKLHIFRSICTRQLTNCGHASSDVQDHIGWNSSTMHVHYQHAKAAALHRKTSFSLADRSDKEDNADFAWRFFNDTDESKEWYHRVVQMAVAGGVPMTGVNIDESLKSKIEAYRGRVERGEVNVDETAREKALKRKLREMEQQLQQLKKQKVAAQETTEEDQKSSADVEKQLVELLDKLKKQSKRQDFDTLCHAQLNQVVDLVERTAAKTGKSFGLQTATSSGKMLTNVLRIADAKILDDKAFVITRPQGGKSWLSWISQVKDTHQVVRQVSTKTFNMYKESIKL